MHTPLPIDLEHLTDFLTGLLNIPSPTGFTDRAIAYLEAELAPLPLRLRRLAKGS